MGENKSLIGERNTLYNTHYLSTYSLSALKRIMHEQQVAAGSYLFWEGELADNLYFIKQGQIKATKTTDEGKEYVLYLFQEGDLIGELASFSELSYSYSALATKECTIGVVEQQELEILLWQHGDIAVELMKWMGLMHRITQSKLRDLMFYGKPGALCSTLIRLAHTFGEEHLLGKKISRKLTNSELGEFIGATRESVNRMLAELTKKGVILQEHGYIIVQDMNYLKSICHCEECPMEVCRM